MMKASVTALLAAGILGGAASAASSCEWYQKQVMATATPPAVEEKTETSATPIDPVLLAKLESVESAVTVEK